MDKTAGSRKWKEGWRCTSNNHKPNPKPTDTRWRPGLGQVTSQEPFAFLMKHSHSSGNEQFPRVCFKHPITKWEKKMNIQSWLARILHFPLCICLSADTTRCVSSLPHQAPRLPPTLTSHPLWLKKRQQVRNTGPLAVNFVQTVLFFLLHGICPWQLKINGQWWER